MNDLYLHQLETENKQLRIALHTTRELLDEQQQRIDKAIEYINNASYFDGSSMCANDLLKILGDGNNE